MALIVSKFEVFICIVHVKPGATRFSEFKLGIVAPPWPLPSIDIYRTTEPKDGVRDEDYRSFHADDLTVLLSDAHGVSVKWTVTTRFELVRPDTIIRDGNNNSVRVRSGRKTRYRKTDRLPDVVNEQWSVMSHSAQKRELAVYAFTARKSLWRMLKAIYFEFRSILPRCWSLPRTPNMETLS